MKSDLKNGVTIIICCYNSAQLLPPTIKHIAKQKNQDNIYWELIVVNNNSTDDTAQVARQEWDKYGLKEVKLSVVNEAQAGLSYARKMGVEAASFEYIIFCDDDNWLSDDYLQTAFRILEENPAIGALGGRSEAIADVAFPGWWNQYISGFAVGRQATESGYIQSRKYLWGAGLVSRKILLSKVFHKDFPSFLSGRKGEELSSGEDVEICARIILMGYLLYYDGNLLLIHYITETRFTVAYRDKMFEGHAKGVDIIKPYHDIIRLSQLSFLHKSIRTLKAILQCLLIPFRKSGNINDFFTPVSAMWNLPFFTFDPQYKQILYFKKATMNSLR
jgi:glycosyltransferase involved in cell wall biosynthesis